MGAGMGAGIGPSPGREEQGLEQALAHAPPHGLGQRPVPHGEGRAPPLQGVAGWLPGSVGGPVVQDIGLNQQGSLPGVEVSRGDIGDPQITNNVEVSLCLS